MKTKVKHVRSAQERDRIRRQRDLKPTVWLRDAARAHRRKPADHYAKAQNP